MKIYKCAFIHTHLGISVYLYKHTCKSYPYTSISYTQKILEPPFKEKHLSKGSLWNVTQVYTFIVMKPVR